MRSPFYITLEATSFEQHKLDRTETQQHKLNALAALELLRDLGRVYAALPEEARGEVAYSDATFAYENLCFALSGLGCLQTALADFAWCEVDQLAKH